MIETTFCSQAWSDIKFSLARRKLQHCCRATLQDFPEDLTVDFINNNSLINERRSYLLEGKRHKQCAICWLEEDTTGSSYRTINGKRLAKEEIESNPNKNFIDRIEIQFDNICDQSCIYCGPAFSSVIAKERGIPERKLNYGEKDLQTVIEWLELFYENDPSEKVIRITGGEPTASKSWYYFIDRLLESSVAENKMLIHTVTNANFKKSVQTRITDYMKKSKNWKWSWALSNESTGMLSENVRFGSSWEKWKENYEFFLGFTNMPFLMISPSPNIFTIKSMPEFFNYVIKTSELLNPSLPLRINLNWVERPDHFNPAYLPVSHKQYNDESLEIISNSNVMHKEQCIAWLNQLKNKIGTKDLDIKILKGHLDKENHYKNNMLNIKLLLDQIN